MNLTHISETEFPIPSAIAYLEFTELGPTLIQQSPVGYLTKDQISQIQNFVFPSVSLFDRNLTILFKNRKIIGHPISVEGEIYPRNHFRFNFLMCFDGNLDIQPYEPILSKIANEFCTYEMEEGFLSALFKPETFQIQLDNILNGLQTSGEVNIEITVNNWLFLKIIPTNMPLDMEPIDSTLVPVLTHGIRTFSHTELDLTIAEFLSRIDEIKPISSLAKESDVTLKEIGSDVSRHLQYFRIIQGFVPIFQYNNAYLITPRISLLLNDSQFQREMISYLRKDFELQVFCMSEIIRLFLSLKHAQSLYQLYRLELNDMQLLGQTNLMRRIIEFGIFNRIIIPLNEYIHMTASMKRKFSGLLGRNEDFVRVDSILWSENGANRDSLLQTIEESDCTTLYI